MELTKEQTNQLHDIEPSIWETIHDLQNEINIRTARWEESAFREKFRFAMRIYDLKCPVMVYNVKLGCYISFLAMETGIVGQPTKITVIGVEYSEGWDIDDCLFFYEKDGFKICEGVGGFLRKKAIFSTKQQSEMLYVSNAINDELEKVVLYTSILSTCLAKRVGAQKISWEQICLYSRMINDDISYHFTNAAVSFHNALLGNKNILKNNDEVF